MASNIEADLTGFPLKIDLRHLPAPFWAGVDDGGGNIRVYAADGMTLIPHDCVSCLPADKTGTLYAKTDLSSELNTVLTVELAPSGTTALAISDPNGQHAVWSDYEVAFIGPDVSDRTGRHALVQAGGIYAGRWKETARSPDLNFHQGIAWSKTHIYAVDTNQLRKYDGVWAQVATNTNPVGDAIAATGITTLNHCGDPAVIGGELWVPLETWHNVNEFGEGHLAVFNLADLTFNRIIDISAGEREASGCCEGPDGHIYVTDYVDGSSVPFYDATGVLQGEISLNTSIVNTQGITYLKGKFYISSESEGGKIYQIDPSGAVDGAIYASFYDGAMEGVTNNGADLIYHKDMQNGFSGIRTISLGTGKEEWVKFHNGRLSTPVNTASSFYMATVFQPAPGFGQGGLASLEASGQRVTLVCDNSPLRYSTWDAYNGYIATGQTKPRPYEPRHIATGYNGAMERKVWADGAVNMRDTGIATIMAGGTATFIIGMAKMAGEAPYSGQPAPLSGQMASALLRLQYPTNDWVAFEALNHKTPSESYIINGV
jgi:hypothetical protein